MQRLTISIDDTLADAFDRTSRNAAMKIVARRYAISFAIDSKI